MEIDFKVWVGIIFVFLKYGLNSSIIEFLFSEFVIFCGFSLKDKDKGFRMCLVDFFICFCSIIIKFVLEKDWNGVVFGLLSCGKWDEKDDIMEFIVDEFFWEFY